MPTLQSISISLAEYNDLKKKEDKLKLFEYVYENDHGRLAPVTYLECREAGCNAMVMEVDPIEGSSMYINCKTMKKCRASLFLANRLFECLDKETYCEKHVHRLTKIDHKEQIYACQSCVASIKDRYCDEHMDHFTSRYDDIYDTCQKCFEKKK